MGHTGGITRDGRAESAAGDAYELRCISIASADRCRPCFGKYSCLRRSSAGTVTQTS